MSRISQKDIPYNGHNASSSKIEFKNTNIIINVGKAQKNKLIVFKKSNKIKMKMPTIINKYKDCELNSFNFEKARIYDKRSFCQYYFSLLKYNNLILFAFYQAKDYNLRIVKISLFLISFDIYFFINSLFFTNDSLHQIYEDRGAYNFSYFFPKIILSFFISYYFIVIIKYFSLSERNILELKEEEKLRKVVDKESKVKRCLIIKYISFYAISFIFLSFFWYYLSSFCAVYINSQFYVMKNTFISFAISLLYPFFFNLLPCILRINSLKKKWQNNKCFYKISKFIQIL